MPMRLSLMMTLHLIRHIYQCQSNLVILQGVSVGGVTTIKGTPTVAIVVAAAGAVPIVVAAPPD